MKNIKYAIDMLLRRPLFMIIIIMQLTITMIFLNISIMARLNTNESTRRINNIFKHKKYYSIQDKSNEEILFKKTFKEKDALDKMLEFYTFLNNSKEFKFIEYYSQNIPIKSKLMDNRFLDFEENPFISLANNKFILLKNINIGKNFFENISFELDEGSMFEDRDFNNTYTKVILGNAFKELYKIGDEIQYYDYSNKSIQTLKVKGFLKKDSYFLQKGTGLINLDYYMILPMKPINLSNKDEITELDFRIVQSLILTDNVESVFSLIQRKSNDLKLYSSINAMDLNEQGKIFCNVTNNMLKRILPICISIFIFTSISIITSLLNIIRRGMKELGVHLLSGATMKDISFRVFYIVLFYIGISCFLGLIISNKLKNSLFPELYSSNIFKYLLPIILVIIGIISFLPILKLFRIEISEVIRRKE